MRGAKELDEAADDSGLDNLLDRRVTLLRQKLPKTGCGLNLQIDLLGEDALHHLREILAQLKRVIISISTR